MKRKIGYNELPGIKFITREKFFEEQLKAFRERTEIFLKNRIKFDEDFSNNQKELLNIFSNQDILNNVRSIFNDCKKNLGNIDYLTKSYFKAAEDSRKALEQLLEKDDDFSNNLCDIIDNGQLSGTLIVPTEKNVKTYMFYRITHNATRIELVEVDYHADLKIFEFSSYFDGQILHVDSEEGSYFIKLKEECNNNSNVGLFVRLLTFKFLAKTEVEIFDLVNENTAPKGTSKFNILDKSKSEGIDVNYYSANWYTEVIRTTGFRVRGHWRNQPYSDGYKLIFIDPYLKKGYHRKSEKDSVTLKGG